MQQFLILVMHDQTLVALEAISTMIFLHQLGAWPEELV